jgi:ATP-binding cassette subfamily F protein uup
LRQRTVIAEQAEEKAAVTAVAAKPQAVKRKLSYNEQRELTGLPGKIEKLEAKVGELHTAMAAPDFFKQAGTIIAAKQAELQSMEAELATAYSRWEELEQS